MSRVFDKFKTIKQLGPETDVPFYVWRLFGSQQKQIGIYGNEICLGEDSASLEEARDAIAWYVEQLGGKVKWEGL